MRRTILLAAATIIGLYALLASFRTTPMPAAAAPPGVSAGPSAPGNRTRAGERVITGPAVPTAFGPVQVRVDLTGAHISDVQAVQLPSDFALSQQISAAAGPILRQEALKAQSAKIDTVSGATYTSRGYRQSLQAALDRAGR
jgi:uncharacterized protein with FMN-binding domain